MATSDKYGKITTEHGEIGEDEPVFMLRARDVLSVATIAHYLELCIKEGSPRQHLDLVLDAIRDFERWQNRNTLKMKIPASKRFHGMADV